MIRGRRFNGSFRSNPTSSHSVPISQASVRRSQGSVSSRQSRRSRISTNTSNSNARSAIPNTNDHDGSAHQDDNLSHYSSAIRSQQDDDYNDDTESQAPSMEPGMVCVSIVDDGPRLAFACYRQDDNAILLQDCPASGYNAEVLIDGFFQKTQPTLILVSLKTVGNEELIDVITKPRAPIILANDTNGIDNPVAGNPQGPSRVEHRRQLGAVDRSIVSQSNEAAGNMENVPFAQDGQTEKIPYRILKSGAFNAGKCTALISNKLRVLSLHRQNQNAQRDGPMRHFGDQNTAYYQPSAYNSIGSLIDWDSVVLVRALGSLLSHLLSTPLYSMDGVVTVNQIIQVHPDEAMFIPNQTLEALHIFSTEHHPLLLRGRNGSGSGGGRSKEGWSLFSLLDRTRSKGGQQVLKEWMMRPLQSVVGIQQRQNVVELFLRADHAEAVGKLLNCLAKIGHVQSMLQRMQRCTTQSRDFSMLARSLSAAIGAFHVLNRNVLQLLDNSTTVNCELLVDIANRINIGVMDDLFNRINSTVDEEATASSKVIVIRAGFHEQLDNWKEQLEDLPAYLDNEAQELHQQHPNLHDVSVAFIPQVGFLVCLPVSLVDDRDTEIPPDFDSIFVQNDEAFFKNYLTHHMDREIGDLDGLIKDMESMIVTDLEEDILDAEIGLQQSFRALAELDCLLAFANSASDSGYVRPQMIDKDSHEITIQNGRHPLQEITTEHDFVPNGIKLTARDRVHVVTGPNFSGKSCYARQIGLLVYMAHIGAFIPCDSAKMSIIKQIVARIQTVETCSVPQSTFQMDLTQMGAILRRATKYSLVLIDEFGKGTSPASGIALLKAALKHLAAARAQVVCTTHFLELFSLGLLEDGADGIKASQMTVQLPSSENNMAAPLFKLKDGVASSSAGLVCAEKAGVDRSIVLRATEIIEAIRAGTKVEPLAELVPALPTFTDIEKKVLACFLQHESWDSATNDQLRTLITSIAEL